MQTILSNAKARKTKNLVSMLIMSAKSANVNMTMLYSIPLLERVNTSLLPYLTSLKSMKSAGYSDFIEGVSQIIANTNSSISARRKKNEQQRYPRQERRRIATKQSFRTTVNILKLVCKRRRQKTAAVIHRLLLLFFVPLHRKRI